jgi:peroxiredoxin
MRVMNEAHPPAVGETAPDFAALDATGARRRLAELCSERPLVLVFYRGHW